MKSLSKVILIALTLMFPAITMAGFIHDIEITPGNPDSSDLITADVLGDFSSTGISLVGSPTVTINNTEIIIDVFSLGVGCCGAAILVPFSSQASIGNLLAGVYNLTANLYLNNVLDATYSESLVVTAVSVAVPQTIWLFVLALCLLVVMKNRMTVTAQKCATPLVA